VVENLLFFSLAVNAGLLWMVYAFARDSFMKGIQIGQLQAEVDRIRARYLQSRTIANTNKRNENTDHS